MIYNNNNTEDEDNRNLQRCQTTFTAQKMKFSIMDFFSKCDQIRRKLRIWSHLLKESLVENFIFCAVTLLGLTFKGEIKSLTLS